VKILYGYPYFPSSAYESTERSAFDYVDRLRASGFDVEPFCLTLSPPSQRLSFRDMDRMWRAGDKALFRMYEALEEALEGKDVLVNSAGINLHPDFVEKLPVFTVLGCNDDPESSDDLSRPVARSYDLCLVGNIAELGAYREWGATNVEWRPMGLSPGFYDPTLSYEAILGGERDIDLFMMIDRMSRWRKPRLDRMLEAFPSGHFYGSGWPRGFLPAQRQIEHMLRAKIGPNFHNSTGPINFRTFYLPANGVMQICDNKAHLGMIYELGTEAVGFDTVEECIELCRYYLAHDEERRRIAANGWRRALRDYSEIAVFARDVALFEKYMALAGARGAAKPGVAARTLRELGPRRHILRLQGTAIGAARLLRRAARGCVRACRTALSRRVGPRAR
jgi:spore maturation protein CgeB